MWLFPKGIKLHDRRDGSEVVVRFPRHWERVHHHGTDYMFRDTRNDTVLQLILFPREPQLTEDQLAGMIALLAAAREAEALPGSFQPMGMASHDSWGQYFISQDRNVKPGEYAWAADGFFVVQERIFSFRILCHRPPQVAAKEAFEILEFLKIKNPS